jgi:hypothetical protein
VKTNKARRQARRKSQMQRRAHRIARRLAQRAGLGGQRPMLRASGIRYQVAPRSQAVSVGGIGLLHLLAERTGLRRAIDSRLHLLQEHRPYHESDHVLNIAFNVACGGTCLEDLELLRNDAGYLDALGAQRIPDCTTAGDFCRRFTSPAVEALADAIDAARLRVWARQPRSFFAEAVIDADGTVVETGAEKKGGIDLSYDGRWGYHPLVVSLGNTQEPLWVENRSGNRPSHEGAAAALDRAVALCARAGFRRILLRGDTDFSQTKYLDDWDAGQVRFLFGYDARSNLVAMARSLAPNAWARLERPPAGEVQTQPRTRRADVKAPIVAARGFRHLTTAAEHVAEFPYQPERCRTAYRMIVLRKTITVTRGQQPLLPEVRHFFFVTNDRHTAAPQLVLLANQRCRQENLIQQLKHGVAALRTPVDSLISNGAYMLMASLAWSLKAWLALVLPEEAGKKTRPSAQHRLLGMEFKRFLHAFIRVPAQIVRTGRRVLYRLLAWNSWQPVFLRLADVLEVPLRC